MKLIMKFLFYLEGNPLIQGHTRLEFKWSPAHGVFLFEGKETEPKDFDAVARTVFGPRYRNLFFPLVKLAGAAAAAAAPVADKPAEITVADAEAVMERLAPHRLKKKPGPKVEELVGA